MSGTVSDDLWLDMFNALWFPLWWAFKTYTEGKKYARHAVSDRFPFPQSQATWGSGQTHNVCVFAFRIHLWRVASKYPANMKSGPLNPLNKHDEKPAANMQTIWNETSLCVFWSWFILGCSSVCGSPITNNKNICIVPLVWMIVAFFFLNIFR